MKGNGRKAKKQIGSESARLHFGLKVAVGRRDKPNIHMFGAGVTEPSEFRPFGETRKRLRLQIEGEITNLINKEGAAMGGIDDSWRQGC
jgi:hypothetical protein